MSDLSGTNLAGLRVVVIGAGVVGLCLSVRLARAGARTTLFDPADVREEASGVAAGMLAPIGEALFDDPLHLPLWRDAARRWAHLAPTIPGLEVDACGARFRDLPHVPEAVALHAVPLSADWFSDEDARLEPLDAFSALDEAFRAAGGRRVRERFVKPPPKTDLVVIAAGFNSRTFVDLAPELGALTPIKGQLLRFAGGPAMGPILRSPRGYLAPSRLGAVIGATMEPGRDDREPTEAARIRLLDVADALHPGLSTTPHRVFAGVRAATPDVLPMVGRATRDGVFIATGMRRNGWLLAPLVSEMVLAYLSGGEVGPFAAALDPRRFARI